MQTSLKFGVENTLVQDWWCGVTESKVSKNSLYVLELYVLLSLMF